MSYPPVPASNKIPQPIGTPSVGEIPQVSQVSPLELEWAASSGSGTVTSVTATDTSIVVSGTDTVAPTIATGTLDVIATQHPPAASVPMNSQKLTGLLNGSAAQDAAAFGQIPTSAGTIGGALTANNLSDLASAATARTNLGLGAVATEAYVSGQYLAVPGQYAPSPQVLITTFGQAMASLNAAATTVAAGSNGGEISAVASWSSPSAGVLDVASTAGWPNAGTISVAASGSTTAVVTYTGTTATALTGCAYVSGSATGTVATGGAVTLTSPSPSVSTGSFTAPSSGSVVVEATFVAQVTSDGSVIAWGLCAHGTITPMFGYVTTMKYPGSAFPTPTVLRFYVTGLTSGNSYNFDLMFAIASGGSVTVYAFEQTATTPSTSASSIGAPVVMTVQAV